MTIQDKLIITQSDCDNISNLLKSVKTETAELLENELARATVVPDTDLPQDVAAMNSRVGFKDLDTGKESAFTLVYPNEADIEHSRISILAPVGSALIGLRVGQTIRWPLPGGREKELEVVSVSREQAA